MSGYLHISLLAHSILFILFYYLVSRIKMLLDLERERPWMVEWGGRMGGSNS